MRSVVYQDSRGKYRRTLIRDEDGDEMAEYGLPDGPPDVEHEIDWTGVAIEINNILVQNGVKTRIDLQRTRSLEKIGSLVKRHVDLLFREHEKQDK